MVLRKVPILNFKEILAKRSRSLAMHMSVDPDFRGGYRLKLFDTAGPAIRWMFLATFCRFLAIILLPFVAVKFTKCTSDRTFAEYEPWLWGPCGVWMLLMLLIASKLQGRDQEIHPGRLTWNLKTIKTSLGIQLPSLPEWDAADHARIVDDACFIYITFKT